MSNMRIRYDEQADGKLRSKRTITTTQNGAVFVELDLSNKKFVILDSMTLAPIFHGGNTSNISVLKIQAKEALETLGAEFVSERRNRQQKPSETN